MSILVNFNHHDYGIINHVVYEKQNVLEQSMWFLIWLSKTIINVVVIILISYFKPGYLSTGCFYKY